ncbi:MAG: nitrate ABC transporter substrate-binding protein, partial [Bacteroidota bacterium]
RWGQIPEAQPAGWYDEKIKEIYRPDLWLKAAAALEAEGKIPAEDIPDTDGYKDPTKDFIDGKLYDAKDPIGYINSFSIGNKDAVQ